jgi:hypothetical protein
MTCGEFVKGHVFDFETLICGRCGMIRSRFEAASQPRCSGEAPPESARHEAQHCAPGSEDDQ